MPLVERVGSPAGIGGDAYSSRGELLIAGSEVFVESKLQTLLGVREGRATELVAAGHRVRVYVPYGDRWYEYSLRRLQENPALAGMLAKAAVLRVVSAGR